MLMKLELIPIPVTDIDRAKTFYTEKIGFHCDHDTRVSASVRVVQLTPTGSGCSIVLMHGMPEMEQMTPGTVKGVHLVVKNAQATSEALTARGVEVSPVRDVGGGVKMASFQDPDGNSWAIQEIPWRVSEF